MKDFTQDEFIGQEVAPERLHPVHVAASGYAALGQPFLPTARRSSSGSDLQQNYYAFRAPITSRAEPCTDTLMRCIKIGIVPGMIAVVLGIL